MNSLLLDTRIFVWMVMNSPKLKDETLRHIKHAETVYVSAATAWEISVKSAIGKIRLPEPVHLGVHKCGFKQLDVKFSHAQKLIELPMHHRDPFDRMLIAQAQIEILTLVTADTMMKRYPIPILFC